MSNTCRRCSVCEGSEHHWLDNPHFGDDEAWERDGAQNIEATHVCKHCDAVGMECEACDGSGEEPTAFDQLCPECKGEGVIKIGGTR